MRIILFSVALVAGPSLAAAQAARVDGAEVTRPGIYRAKVAKEIKDPSISTGQRQEITNIELVEITTLIPAKTDSFFGLEGIIHGAPKGMRIPVQIIWRYPEPGLKNPNGGDAKLVDDFVDGANIEQTFSFYWNLTQDWHLVPGVWTFEMWYQGRKLVSQNFTLVKQ